MKYVCPGCDRLVELRAFRLDAGALVLCCPRCGEESRAEPSEPGRAALAESAQSPPPPRPSLSPQPLNVVPLRPGTSEAVRLAAEAAGSDDPFRVPEGRCPKCVAPRPEGATACPGCGLTYELFDPETVRPSAKLSEEWVGLLRRWDDTAVHDGVLQAAMARGELATVGRLYRLRLAICADDPIAMRGRDEVVRLATAHAAAVPASDELAAGGVAAWKLGPAIAFVFLLMAALLMLGKRLLVSSAQ